MRLIEWILGNPRIFDWQQRVCNPYENVREHFKQYLDVAGKDILDVGCSTAACAGVVVSMERNRYIGIDIEPRYIDFAAKRYPAGKFMVMDARDLTFDSDSFDVIMFVGALHHMDSELIKSCFKELRRVVRKDGVVLCAEPLFTPGHRLSTFFLNRDRGKYIRNEAGYQSLFDGFAIQRKAYLRLAVHRFCSFVLTRDDKDHSVSQLAQVAAGST